MNTDNPTEVTYKYGAMSSAYTLTATDKLIAYATMVAHYNESCHLMVIYEPEGCESWTSFNGETSKKLDAIFGGDGSFEKFLGENIDKIRACMKTITQVV